MIDHIGIRTANADKLILFYTNVLATLGIEKKAENPGGACFVTTAKV
ncbi:hypothetical protein [Solimicrobium silvestre]|uniref:Glyoxalase/Bleomycin resistance protein/Dioxygenase superfamily n=1 Tax=Solimicrobium silvestre TaxID=2099400 RepID=A0A2S9H243_9BURK|nr:hypothetical protein [Solimicrobium silvestre]PRC94054.1 hypothetical protein S2091_1227 [Solimicrobium silvestre]